MQVGRCWNLKDKEAGTYRGIWATNLLTTYKLCWMINITIASAAKKHFHGKEKSHILFNLLCTKRDPHCLKSIPNYCKVHWELHHQLLWKQSNTVLARLFLPSPGCSWSEASKVIELEKLINITITWQSWNIINILCPKLARKARISFEKKHIFVFFEIRKKKLNFYFEIPKKNKVFLISGLYLIV